MAATLGRWFTAGFRAQEAAKVDAVAGSFRAIDREGYAAACEAIAHLLAVERPVQAADQLGGFVTAQERRPQG